MFAICVSLSVKFLYVSFAYFPYFLLGGEAFRKLIFKGSLYTVYCYPLSVIYLANTFSQFVALIFFIEYFEEQKFLF